MASLEAKREVPMVRRASIRLIGAVALCLVYITGVVMAQKPNPFEPFTAEEFVRALRLVVSEEEAQQIEHAFGDKGIETARATGWGWSDDFLVLLSLESEELRLKVERFRREELRITDPAEEKRFEDRRALLKRWLDASDPSDRTRLKPPVDMNE